MVGAVIYEQIKKRIRDREEQNRPETPSSNDGRNRHIQRPAAVKLDFEKDETPVPDHRRLETPIARASRLRPVPVEGECSLAESHQHPGSATLKVQQDAPEAVSEPGNEASEAHFSRWRQAIIDTQILERKF